MTFTLQQHLYRNGIDMCTVSDQFSPNRRVSEHCAENTWLAVAKVAHRVESMRRVACTCLDCLARNLNGSVRVSQRNQDTL